MTLTAMPNCDNRHGYYRYDCQHATNGKKRCPQCWEVKAYPEEFVGVSGGVVVVCHRCSEYHRTRRELRKKMHSQVA